MRDGGANSQAMQRVLLASGVAYALVYAIANDVVAAAAYQGYSRLSQAVSELSATGAPTKAFLTAMLPLFCGLEVAFGIGVWRAAGGRRALRVTGMLLVAHALTAPLWLLAPMSSREVIAAGGGTWQDTGHLIMTAWTVAVILAQLGFGAAAFGRPFRIYSIASAALMLGSGALTSAQSAEMVAGRATPWLGLTERVGMVAWLVWMSVLGITLLREGRASRSRPKVSPAPAPQPAMQL